MNFTRQRDRLLSGAGRWACLFLILCLAHLALAAQDDENSVAVFLRGLEDGLEPGESYRVTEADLNRFMLEEIERQRVAAVESITVKLLPGRFQADLAVDLDQLEKGENNSAALFQSMFRGVQKLALEGKVEATEGVATYETIRASLNGVPIPASVVDLLLKSVGKKQEPPFDPTEPFPLPRGIDSIRLVSGAAEIAGAPR
jgi:hypothetical protein